VSRARKRKNPRVVKGGRFVEARRSSSRERRAIDEGDVGPFAFRCVSGSRVAAAGGRHLGSGKRTPFTRPPRNRSWRPPSHSEGSHQRPALTSSEEATGVSEAVVTDSAAEENALARSPVRSPKWESRRETRLSPASFASGGPSLPVPASRVLGRGRWGAVDAARMSTRREPRNESNPRTGAERPRAEPWGASLGNDGARVLD